MTEAVELRWESSGSLQPGALDHKAGGTSGYTGQMLPVRACPIGQTFFGTLYPKQGMFLKGVLQPRGPKGGRSAGLTEAARFERRGISGLKLWATRHKGTRSRRGRCSSRGGGVLCLAINLGNRQLAINFGGLCPKQEHSFLQGCCPIRQSLCRLFRCAQSKSSIGSAALSHQKTGDFEFCASTDHFFRDTCPDHKVSLISG